MTVPLPAAFVRAPVTWKLGHATRFGPLAGARGVVQFEATAKAIAYSDATVLPSPVETPIVGGMMTPVDLIVNDSEVWNWKVSPRVGIAWEPFHVDVPAGGIDLASASVTPGVGPVRVIKGDPGPKGATGPEGPEGPYGGTTVTDPQVASMVAGDTATRNAVDAAVLERGGQGAAVDLASGVSALTKEMMVQHALLANRRAEARAMPDEVTILAANESSSWLRSGTTVTAVTDGWKIATTVAAGGLEAYIEPSPARPIAPAQAVCMDVYVPDPSQITNLALRLFQSSTVTWNRGTTSDGISLVPGWNRLRFKMANGLPVAWEGTELTRIGVQIGTTVAGASVTVKRVWMECPEKAKLLFILDRGYKTFINAGGLDDLRALGVPVTWALDITQLGRNVGDAFDVITAEDVMHYAAEGDSISFHGWDGNPTAGMTPEQAREDTRKSVDWLRERGYAGRLWRAAWVQDTTTPENSAAVRDLVIAQAQWKPHSVRVDTWPPMDRHNIARWAMFNMDDAARETQMSILRRTRGLLLAYNHGIQPAYPNDATQQMWDHFVGQITLGLTQGWLEATTFEDLFFDTPGSVFGI